MSRQQALKELDLRAGYDGGDLKRAYRARAIATHPDKGGSPEAFLPGESSRAAAALAVDVQAAAGVVAVVAVQR